MTIKSLFAETVKGFFSGVGFILGVAFLVAVVSLIK